MVPAIDGRDGLRGCNVGGAIESRLVLLPTVDGLGVLEGVVAWEVLPDEPVELSCFVGDLLGDCPCQLRSP